MENVKVPSLRESQATAFGVLRPVFRVLRSSGVDEGAVRSAWERVCRQQTGTPVRGVWLDRACCSQLAGLVRIWARDPEFIDATGAPLKLWLARGGRPRRDSFAYLLRKAEVSIRAGSALEQLQALGSVQRCNRGQCVRLVSDVLRAAAGKRFLAVPMLDAVRRFAETVEHNLCEKPAAARGRMQGWVGCASLDARQLNEIERFVRSSGQAFLDAADEKLLSCARKGARKLGISGVGLYVFVDRAGQSAGRHLRERCGSA